MGRGTRRTMPPIGMEEPIVVVYDQHHLYLLSFFSCIGFPRLARSLVPFHLPFPSFLYCRFFVLHRLRAALMPFLFRHVSVPLLLHSRLQQPLPPFERLVVFFPFPHGMAFACCRPLSPSAAFRSPPCSFTCSSALRDPSPGTASFYQVPCPCWAHFGFRLQCLAASRSAPVACIHTLPHASCSCSTCTPFLPPMSGGSSFYGVTCQPLLCGPAVFLHRHVHRSRASDSFPRYLRKHLCSFASLPSLCDAPPFSSPPASLPPPLSIHFLIPSVSRGPRRSSRAQLLPNHRNLFVWGANRPPVLLSHLFFAIFS
jgi:hypothetical protein